MIDINAKKFGNTVIINLLAHVNSMLRKNEFDPETEVLLNQICTNPNDWHSIDENFRVLKEIERCFGEDAIEKLTYSFYAKSKLREVTTLIGLLMSPAMVFRNLKGLASNFNHYNSYEFDLLTDGVSRKKGRLRQFYPDPSRIEHNRLLAKANRGSIQGVFQFFGFAIIEFREISSVGPTSNFCEHEFTWRESSIFKIFTSVIAIAFAFFFVLKTKDQFLFDWKALGLSVCLSGFIACLYLLRKRTQALLASFEYQTDLIRTQQNAIAKQQELQEKIVQHQNSVSELMKLAQIGEMSYSIVHDMANPLVVLAHSSDRLNKISGKKEMTDYDQKLTKNINDIELATARLTEMQRVLRVFVKSDGNTSLVHFDLKKSLEGTIGLFRSLFFSNEIDFELNLELPSNSMITCPEGAIESLLMNLFSNSIKALKNSPVKVISLHVSETSSGKYRLQIQDSGPGFSSERLRETFKRFGTSGARLSDLSSPSTGFGLYQIDKLRSLLGAEMEINSSENGTSFIFVVPKHPPERITKVV